MKITNILVTAMVFFLSGACESFVNGVNEADVTRAQDADLKLIVTAAEINYIGVLEGDIAANCGLWNGYLAPSSFTSPAYSYNVTAFNSDSWWNNVYTGTLKSLRIAEQKAAALNNLSTKGACQVIEASLLGTAAALWGDVPYAQAIDAERFPDPVYDNQLGVIKTMILLLDSAIYNLERGAGGTRQGDFLSAGNTNNQWIRTAHSAKARLHLYVKDYSNGLAEANLGIQLPADDLLAPHSSLTINTNLYSLGQYTGANTFLAKILDRSSSHSRNHLKTDESARVASYYLGTSADNYALNSAAGGYFALDASFPLHTSSETILIAAECYLLLGDFDKALGKLNQHRATLRTRFPAGTYDDMVASDFDPGGIENPLGTRAPKDALLLEIIEEKYVCLIGQVEGFNETRRTRNLLGIPPNRGTQLPQRFLYSQIEINANANTPNPIPDLFDKTELFK
jgi:hypothetical protein